MNSVGYTQPKDEVLELLTFLPPEPASVNYILICKELDIPPKSIQGRVTRAIQRGYNVGIDTINKTIWLNKDGADVAQADAEEYMNAREDE